MNRWLSLVRVHMSLMFPWSNSVKVLGLSYEIAERGESYRREAFLMSVQAVIDLWEKIESLLQEKRPEYLQVLNDGASKEQIAQLESLIGLKLPEEIRVSLQRHDGQKQDVISVWGGQELLSCEGIAYNWQTNKELLDEGVGWNDGEVEEGVKQQWWSPQWIPWLNNGGGDLTCIDLDPAADGKVGQVIDVGHDSGERPLLYPSFVEFMADFVEDLKSGAAFYYDD